MGKRQRFDAEFREGAVRIVLESGRSAAEVARDLGVYEGTLQNWVHKARAGAAAAGAGPLDESERRELALLRAENRQLRKENVELGMERDVLKRLGGPVGEVAVANPALLVGVISDCRTEDDIPHKIACRALGVSEAWFYKRRKGSERPTKREVRLAALTERIEQFFTAWSPS